MGSEIGQLADNLILANAAAKKSGTNKWRLWIVCRGWIALASVLYVLQKQMCSIVYIACIFIKKNVSRVYIAVYIPCTHLFLQCNKN